VRNGCVFRADWQGKTVAVKQFDLGRQGVFSSFRIEISAYEKLKLAQGVLVPKALFLTQSMGIAYLGLELGRDPAEGDDVSSWLQVLEGCELSMASVTATTMVVMVSLLKTAKEGNDWSPWISRSKSLWARGNALSSLEYYRGRSVTALNMESIIVRLLFRLHLVQYRVPRISGELRRKHANQDTQSERT
jgi:hypothetical protein